MSESLVTTQFNDELNWLVWCATRSTHTGSGQSTHEVAFCDNLRPLVKDIPTYGLILADKQDDLGQCQLPGKTDPL